jgi:hypothetical protein
MIFETTFNIGDKGWVYWGEAGVRQATIGKITVEHTDSKGTEGSWADNYKPQKEHLEKYMCEETGIGSGAVYTMNEHIFKTEEECRAKYAEEIARQEKEKREAEEYRKKEKLSKEWYLREQLAEIERIKGEM